MTLQARNGLLVFALLIIAISSKYDAASINGTKLRVHDINDYFETSANQPHQEAVYPSLSSSPQDNSFLPHFHEIIPNFPHENHHSMSSHPETPVNTPFLSGNENYPQEDRSFMNEARVPSNNINYGPDNNRNQHYRQQAVRNPDLHKSMREFFFPYSESDQQQNVPRVDNAMLGSEYDSEQPIPYEQYEQSSDKNRDEFGREKSDPDYGMDGDDSENDEEQDHRDEENTRKSIDNDIKDYGKEAKDEANQFEKFLENLGNFANTESDYHSSPKGEIEGEEMLGPNNKRGPEDDVDDPEEQSQPPKNEHPLYKSHQDASFNDNDENDDSEYESPSGYGGPDEYDGEKDSYQRKRDDSNRNSGHQYHKDRRRPSYDEAYEQRRVEVTKLIDDEPEESDYLSNSDVIQQLKSSEEKYKTGVNPIFASPKDFDEVKRLEKLIEFDVKSNKKKGKDVSQEQDKSQEGSEKVEKIEKKDKTEKTEKREKKEKKKVNSREKSQN